MNRKKLKVAVIGTGMVANAAHLPAWKDLADEVEVVGVADPRENAVQETAKRYEVSHVYADPQKMLDELQPDIVSVCTPNVFHKEWTLAGLNAGAHVLVEKPMATSYADAVEMFSNAERLGKMLYVCQSSRFMNAFMAARHMAEEGVLGEGYYADISAVRRRGIPTWGFFHMKKYNAGGPVFDLGVHVLDAVLWVMGNPRVTAVSGMTYRKFGDVDEGLVTSLADSGAPLGVFTPRPYDYREFDVEDFASGYLRLENGGTMNFRTSWAVNLPEDINMTIAGTQGCIQFPPLRLMNNLGHYQVDVNPRVPKDRDVFFAGHYGLTANFLKALRGEEEMLVKKEEALNVIRAIEGLYRSAEVGREIWFDETP